MAEQNRRRRHRRAGGASSGANPTAPSPAPSSPPPPAPSTTPAAQPPAPSSPAPPTGKTGPRRPRDAGSERGLRDLVGAGRSQLGVSGALRARDLNRPTEEDLAEAERDLVIVRRRWKPDDQRG